MLKLALAFCLALFATSAFSDALDDHKAALRAANAEFIAAFEKCEDTLLLKARNKCRGVAKAQHTRAVERADEAMTQAMKKARAK